MKLPPGHVAGVGVVKPTGYGGYGERMLKTMGWDKGQGLGRTGEGIKEAIQVKKKEDSVGVSEEGGLEMLGMGAGHGSCRASIWAGV